MRSQARANEKAILKCQKLIEEKEAAIENHKEQIQNVETELKSLTSEAFGVMEAYKQSQLLVEEKARDLKATSAAFEKKDKEESTVSHSMNIL